MVVRRGAARAAAADDAAAGSVGVVVGGWALNVWAVVMAAAVASGDGVRR